MLKGKGYKAKEKKISPADAVCIIWGSTESCGIFVCNERRVAGISIYIHKIFYRIGLSIIKYFC